MEWNKVIKKIQTDGYCVIENFLDIKDLKLMQDTTKNYTSEKGSITTDYDENIS